MLTKLHDWLVSRFGNHNDRLSANGEEQSQGSILITSLMLPERIAAQASAAMASNLERIQTPVSVMSHSAQHLLDHYGQHLDESGLNVLRSIVENGRLANGYLRDTTLLVELPHNGGWLIVPEQFDPSHLMHLVINEVDDRIRAKKLIPKFQLDPSLPNHIYQDTRLLRRTTMALVDNAIRNTERGWIEIRLWRGSDPETFCLIIQDTGCGISPQRLKEIRLLLEHGLQIPERRHISAGMGLALADLIAKQLGGRLDIESAVGVGTTATITLPVRYQTPMPTAT